MIEMKNGLLIIILYSIRKKGRMQKHPASCN